MWFFLYGLFAFVALCTSRLLVHAANRCEEPTAVRMKYNQALKYGACYLTVARSIWVPSWSDCSKPRETLSMRVELCFV